jgi:hypothetical protein
MLETVRFPRIVTKDYLPEKSEKKRGFGTQKA